MGTKGATYTRISLDRAGDEHGVTNQGDELRRLAAVRDITITADYSDNDISALTGKHRPGYAALMRAVTAGEIDAILIYQSSRLWRDREERGRDIKLLRAAAVSVIAARGPSLDCSTAQGRAMAGLLGEFDTMESEIKGERQQLANAADARAGKRRKGTPRPFGWQPDRQDADPAEGPAVAAAVKAVIAGGSVAGITRQWAESGLRPPQAPFGPLPEQPWSRSTVRTILLNPALAGLSVYRGDIVGAGTWAPLVRAEDWEACRNILTRPERRPSRGTRTLLGGIAYCPCGRPVMGSVNHLGTHVYRCPPQYRAPGSGPHVSRIAADVDRYVSEAVVRILGRPRAADRLLRRAEGPDMAALAAEANTLRGRMADLGADYADGLIDRAAMRTGAERVRARLAKIDAQLADSGRESVLAPLVAAASVRAGWDALDLSRRRAVVAALMRVDLLSPGRGCRAEFDPASVRLTPN